MLLEYTYTQSNKLKLGLKVVFVFKPKDSTAGLQPFRVYAKCV